MTLRVALLACALALADASELGNSRQRLLSRDKRKRRLPPMAFQLGETVYEADQQKLKECERRLAKLRAKASWGVRTKAEGMDGDKVV